MSIAKPEGLIFNLWQLKPDASSSVHHVCGPLPFAGFFCPAGSTFVLVGILESPLGRCDWALPVLCSYRRLLLPLIHLLAQEKQRERLKSRAASSFVKVLGKGSL